MSDDRDVLMNAIMALLDDAVREGAKPYDIVSTMAAVMANVLGALKPDAREEAAAFLVSRLHVGINYEDFVAAKEARGRPQ